MKQCVFAFNIIRISCQHALDFGHLFGVTKTEISEMYVKTVVIAIGKGRKSNSLFHVTLAPRGQI